MRSILLSMTLLLVNVAMGSVQLSLSPERCHPGDVVTLHAVMTREQYAKFELKLPRHDNLVLISRERGPVRLEDGMYQQAAVWHLQTVHSGDIQLESIQAILHQANGPETIPLPALHITVSPYSQTDESFLPLPLPDEPTAPKPSTHKLIWLLMIVGAPLAGYAWRLNKRNPAIAPGPAQEPSDLERLREAIAQGQTPNVLIISILENPQQVLPPDLRNALEQAVYGASFDIHELSRLLKEEAAP